MKDKSMLISSILISASLLVSSTIIYLSNSNISKSISNNSESSTSDNHFMNAEEAANYLGIGKGDLLYIAKDNSLGLNYICINGRYIFSKEALEEWVKSNKIEISGRKTQVFKQK